MKKFLPYIFAFITGFTATNGLPLLAGGCSSHIEKSDKINCVEGDTECQTEKAEKFNVRKSVKS